METQELLYPQVPARMDPHIFDKSVEVETHSSKTSCFDRIKIRFMEEFQPKIALAHRDEATIESGHDDVLDKTFTGFAAKPHNAGGFVDKINLKDEMLLLESTIIDNTFLDTTPQEMIAYCLTQADISEMRLAGTAYPKRMRLSTRQINIIEVISMIHAAWGIKEPFFFSPGVLYWDKKPQQSKIYSFEYGVNILFLTRFGNVQELETVSAPSMKHSYKITVEYPKVSSEFEASSVKTITNEGDFIRTYINF